MNPTLWEIQHCSSLFSTIFLFFIFIFKSDITTAIKKGIININAYFFVFHNKIKLCYYINIDSLIVFNNFKIFYKH